ncbi:SDR family oxidoreductase [Bradyrhizobium sp. 2TAF24]|uniref:SDR family oxidoreductase n=1 Tax=Bradyrhizobium sp. 2TAF24 TaxID=3233011 RepID=UPI003F909227
MHCDLTNQEQIVRTIRAISGLGAKIHYVINGAGDSRFLGTTTDATIIAEDARRQFELHVFAPAVICSALFQFQWKNIPVREQLASVLNITSLSGVQVFKGTGQGFYAASKAAAHMLTMHMAAEYGRYGVRVNALAPNSFPRIVGTEVVASNALRISNADVTGRIFKIDGAPMAACDGLSSV